MSDFNIIDGETVAPAEVELVPQVSWPEETEAEIDGWLEFVAARLKLHGQSLLRGETTLCDDMLIASRLRSIKEISMNDYFKIFREECAALPEADRRELEEAMALKAARPVAFLLQDWAQSGRVRGERCLTALQEFISQYLQ